MLAWVSGIFAVMPWVQPCTKVTLVVLLTPWQAGCPCIPLWTDVKLCGSRGGTKGHTCIIARVRTGSSRYLSMCPSTRLARTSRSRPSLRIRTLKRLMSKPMTNITRTRPERLLTRLTGGLTRRRSNHTDRTVRRRRDRQGY